MRTIPTNRSASKQLQLGVLPLQTTQLLIPETTETY